MACFKNSFEPIAIISVIFSVTQHPNSGLVRLPVQVSITHTDTQTHTRAQKESSKLVNSTSQKYLHNIQQTYETNNHALGWVRNRDLSNLMAADLRLRPHGHQNRLVIFSELIFRVY